MPDSENTFYIDGAWVAPSSSATIAIVEAATELPLGTVADADETDVGRAAEAACRARRGWAGTCPQHRAELMEHLAGGVEKRSREIGEAIARQNGMPLAFAVQTNADAMAAILRYYAALARAGAPDEVRAALTFPGTVRLQREPVGVVAVIVPWNYPLGLAALKLAPALAAGCTVVLKPAPETSLDSRLLMDAVEEAGFPPGVVNLITGGGAAGEALVRHPAVDKVSFTGSTAVGRAVGAICGAALNPVTLELGGKSAAVVLPDADLNRVMEGLGFLSFANTGESCFLNSRVLAPRARHEEIVDGLTQVARSFRLGDPLAPDTTMGPLVSERQRRRVEAYIAAGRGQGARLATGGGRPGGLERGWFVEPTVFADVDNSMTVAREEIFGPVVCVIPYDTEDEAVSIANDSDYGLAGSVWSADADRALSVARRIDTGSIGINMWMPDTGSPFGGWKASGLGVEGGPEGLAAYTRVKSVYVPGG
jgi:acyl-CoA reductase-like NAD-dependent aldehyde dehydrogenase